MSDRREPRGQASIEVTIRGGDSRDPEIQKLDALLKAQGAQVQYAVALSSDISVSGVLSVALEKASALAIGVLTGLILDWFRNRRLGKGPKEVVILGPDGREISRVKRDPSRGIRH